LSPAGPEAGAALVVGYGNTLRSDDGVGPAVAERLAGDARLEGVVVRVEHQLTPELTLDASRSSLVVLVDAEVGPPPGEIAIQNVVAAASGEGGPPMTHHLDPAGLAGLALELWGTAPPIVVVSVGAASVEVGEHLTAVVEAAIPRAVETVISIVLDHARTGHVPAERVHA
jgi:hydrogenase maturation protease